MGCLFDSPGETKTRRLACLILYLNSFYFIVRLSSIQKFCLVAGDTTQVFSISCRFLNYINQLTVIICYQSVSILSFIDWSSLDIAKHVASNTFHEHFGSSMEKKTSAKQYFLVV